MKGEESSSGISNGNLKANRLLLPQQQSISVLDVSQEVVLGDQQKLMLVATTSRNSKLKGPGVQQQRIFPYPHPPRGSQKNLGIGKGNSLAYGHHQQHSTHSSNISLISFNGEIMEINTHNHNECIPLASSTQDRKRQELLESQEQEELQLLQDQLDSGNGNQVHFHTLDLALKPLEKKAPEVLKKLMEKVKKLKLRKTKSGNDTVESNGIGKGADSISAGETSSSKSSSSDPGMQGSNKKIASLSSSILELDVPLIIPHSSKTNNLIQSLSRNLNGNSSSSFSSFIHNNPQSNSSSSIFKPTPVLLAGTYNTTKPKFKSSIPIQDSNTEFEKHKWRVAQGKLKAATANERFAASVKKGHAFLIAERNTETSTFNQNGGKEDGSCITTLPPLDMLFQSTEQLLKLRELLAKDKKVDLLKSAAASSSSSTSSHILDNGHTEIRPSSHQHYHSTPAAAAAVNKKEGNNGEMTTTKSSSSKKAYRQTMMNDEQQTPSALSNVLEFEGGDTYFDISPWQG